MEVASSYVEYDAEIAWHAHTNRSEITCARRYHNKQCESLKFYIGKHHLSSHAGMKSSEDEDDDLGDGFCELETQSRSTPCESNDESISESELSDGGNDDEVAGLKQEQELSDIKAERSKTKFEQKRTSVQLLNVVLRAPGFSTKTVLHKWVEDGNEVNKSDILMIILNLRKLRMYGKALQVG